MSHVPMTLRTLNSVKRAGKFSFCSTQDTCNHAFAAQKVSVTTTVTTTISHRNLPE